MELHQLLRHVSITTPIILLDIDGIEICRVSCKNEINVDLYRYSILRITTGIPKNSQGSAMLVIIIDK